MICLRIKCFQNKSILLIILSSSCQFWLEYFLLSINHAMYLYILEKRWYVSKIKITIFLLIIISPLIWYFWCDIVEKGYAKHIDTLVYCPSVGYLLYCRIVFRKIDFISRLGTLLLLSIRSFGTYIWRFFPLTNFPLFLSLTELFTAYHEKVDGFQRQKIL